MTDVVESIEHEQGVENLLTETIRRLDAIIYLLELVANQDLNTTLENIDGS